MRLLLVSLVRFFLKSSGMRFGHVQTQTTQGNPVPKCQARN